MAESKKSKIQNASIVLTSEQYEELKKEDKLPSDVDIEIVEEDVLKTYGKVPEGAIETKDPLKNSKFGKRLVEKYGKE